MTSELLNYYLEHISNANRRALRCIQASTKKSADRVGGKDLHIPVGNLVLLRDHPEGRNKIQDHYKTDPYVVTRLHSDPNVYYIKPVNGKGVPKKVNRRQLFDLKRSLVEEEGKTSTPEPDSETVPPAPAYQPKGMRSKPLPSHPYNTRSKGKVPVTVNQAGTGPPSFNTRL